MLYTLGEILYTGTGTALVIAGAPPELLGRALVRFQLSTGIGTAAAPAVLAALFAAGPAALWLGLAAITVAAVTALGLRPARVRRQLRLAA
ncbi:hypothetical protein ACFQX7_38735 [Luedemannella flava]